MKPANSASYLLCVGQNPEAQCARFQSSVDEGFPGAVFVPIVYLTELDLDDRHLSSIVRERAPEKASGWLTASLARGQTLREVLLTDLKKDTSTGDLGFWLNPRGIWTSAEITELPTGIAPAAQHRGCTAVCLAEINTNALSELDLLGILWGDLFYLLDSRLSKLAARGDVVIEDSLAHALSRVPEDELVSILSVTF